MYEWALSSNNLFADGACDFFTGIEELDVGYAVAKKLDATAYLGKADAWTERHGIPMGRVVEEYLSDSGEARVVKRVVRVDS